MNFATNTVNERGYIVPKESKPLRECKICFVEFKPQRESVMCCSLACGVKWRNRNVKQQLPQ